MSHAFAQDASEDAAKRAKHALTPAEGTRGGLSQDYFDKLAEDVQRDTKPTPAQTSK